VQGITFDYAATVPDLAIVQINFSLLIFNECNEKIEVPQGIPEIFEEV
jgi:hypothetical protein